MRSNTDEMTPLADMRSRPIYLRAEIYLIGAQLAVLAASRLFQPATLVDDAYIHFRNALNWANGEGLVFNPGEWVLGTTAPVWALLLGIFHRVTGADIPRIATILNLLCDCGTMLLAMRWFERCGIPLLFRHGLVLVLTLEPLRMYYSVGGMEMSLFIVSLMGIMELARGEQGKLAGILLGMIGWIRPEGAILWIAIPVALVIAKKKKLAGNMLFVAVGVAAAAALLQIHAFGTFIPQSLRAKSTAPWYREAGGLCHVWFLIKLGDLTPFYPLNGFEAGWVSAADRINALAMASAQIALMAIGTLFMVRKGEGFAGWAMSLFAVGEYIFYAAASPQIFPWYYIPEFFSGLLLAGMGWAGAVEWGEGIARAKFPSRLRLAGGCAAAGSAILVILMILTAAHGAEKTFFEGEDLSKSIRFRVKPVMPDQREANYIKAAKVMRSWVLKHPQWRAGCMEIGIFGYYFRGRVLDSYGLVSPEAIEAANPEKERGLDPECRFHPASVFMALRPELIMISAHWWPADPAPFLDVYQPVHIPGVSGLRIFARKDVAGYLDGPKINP